MQCKISRSVLDGVRRACATAEPEEACGLLFGSYGEIDAWQAADNVSENPAAKFEIDPKTLFAALRSERAGGPRVAGYWHSHPSGSTQPSATDAAMAAPDGKLWMICTGEAVALWRAAPAGAVYGRFDAVEIVES